MKRQTVSKLIELMIKFRAVGRDVMVEMGERDYMLSGTKNSGQLRRLSMDITRKLAELRAGK